MKFVIQTLLSGFLISFVLLIIRQYFLALDFPKDDEECMRIIPRHSIKLPDNSKLPTTFSRGINKILEEEDFYGDLWFQPLVEMTLFHKHNYPNAPTDLPALNLLMEKVVRKYWEFAQGVYAMHVLGILRNDTRALGIGSGHEEILYYLTSRVAHVTAVDLYDHGGWRSREGTGSMVDTPWMFARLPYPREKLSVKRMDATSLTFPDASFDCIFSFSAIEHFYSLSYPNGGFLSAASKAVREMGRVARPGGVVVIVTEVILNGRGHFDWVGNILPMRNFFLPEEIETFIIQPAAESGLHLVEDIDWSISNRTLAHSVPLGRCKDDRPHLVLRSEGVVWTSISLVFTKS